MKTKRKKKELDAKKIGKTHVSARFMRGIQQ